MDLLELPQPNRPSWAAKKAVVQQFCSQLTVELGSFNDWSLHRGVSGVPPEQTICNVKLPIHGTLVITFQPKKTDASESALWVTFEGKFLVFLIFGF